jgi:transposase
MHAAFLEGRRRRRHSDEFKAAAVAACLQPGISMAAVATANGINANLLRRWAREEEVKTEVTQSDRASADATAPPGPAFMPLTLPPLAAPTTDIRIELRRGPRSRPA